MTQPCQTSVKPHVHLWQLWRQGEQPDVADFLAGFPDLTVPQQLDVLLIDQKERWQLGQRIPAENYLRRFPALEDSPEAVVELAYNELVLREEHGEAVTLEEYLHRFRQHADRLRRQVEIYRALLPGKDSSPSRTTNPEAPLVTLGLEPAEEEVSGRPAVPGYDLLGEVGRGGMGVVYQARHLRLGCVVALKMVLAGAHARPEALDRFRREAEAVARVNHPNIVHIFEIGTHAGLPFLSLEFCPGNSLERRLGGTPLPPGQAAELVEQLARAIQVVHNKGVIHRDLKPANVLMGEDGTPKITDFGLAKIVDEARHTESGDILGTPSYMAPEQAQGNQVSAAADVYSLGAVLYECLTGRPPFKAATTMDTMLQVISDEPVAPRLLNARTPIDLETICLKCLEKEVPRRYASAQELADDLRSYQDRLPIKARPLGRLGQSARWVRRNPLVAGLTAAVALALLLGASVALFFAVRANENAAQAKEKEQEARENAEEAKDYAARLLEKKNEVDAALGRENKARESAVKTSIKLEDNLYYVYYAEMNLAREAAESRGGTWRVQELLENWRPGPGERDRRGWEWYYLRGQGSRPLLSLQKHTGGVAAVSWSPDGRRLASGGHDRTIRLWDTRTGRELAVLRGHTDQIFGVCWSPDGRRLASTGNLSIRLWDADTGVTTAILDAGAGWMENVSWSPDGRRLANAGTGDNIRIWDANTGQLLRQLRGHKGHVYSVNWASDSRRLASASSDRTVRIWDADRGKQIAQLDGTDNIFHWVSWAPDGRRLVSGGGLLQVWEIETKKFQTLSGHAGPVSAVSWSPDGQQLASAGYDQTVRLWDADTGREKATFAGHINAVSGLSWDPTGRRLASTGWDGTIKVWDTQATQNTSIIRGLSKETIRVAWSPDGRRLAGGGEQGTIRVWDSQTGRDIAVLRGHTDIVRAVSWHPDGHQLASTSEDGTVRVWNVDTKQELAQIAQLKNNLDVSWSPDGRLLAVADSGALPYTIKLWNPTKREEPANIRRHADSFIISLAWDPNGRRLACACEGNKTVELWDVATGKELGTLTGHADAVSAVCWSRDGKKFVSASNDGTIRLWNAQTRQEIAILRGHSGRVRWLSWCPDGRLASVGFDQTVKLWDVDSARETLTLHGHTDAVNGVCWSPSGLRLASASEDQTIRIWDATPGYAEERSPLLLPELDRRLKVNPRSAADLHLRAEIHARLGQWDRAAVDWVQAVAGKDAKQSRWFQAGWWVAGPFPGSAALEQVSDTEPDPLKPAGPGAGSVLAWKATSASSNGCLDLGAMFPQAKTGTARALLRVYCPRTQLVAAVLGGTGSVRFWHNGQLVHQVERPQSAQSDDEALPLTLRAGWNTLLFQASLASGKDRLCLWLSAEPADCIRALADRGRWDEAAALLSEALKQQPISPEMLLAAGRIFRKHADSLHRLGQQDQARRADDQVRSAYEKLLVLRPDHDGYAKEFADFLLNQAMNWQVLKPGTRESAGGTTLTPLSDDSILASGKNPLPETYTITTQPRSMRITALRLELLPDPSLPLGGPGRADNGNMHLDEFRVTAAPAHDPKKARQLVFRGAWADFAEDGWPVTTAFDGKAETGWSVHPQPGQAHYAVFELAEPITVADDSILTFTLYQQHNAYGWPHTIGRFRLSATSHPLAGTFEPWRPSSGASANGWINLAGAHWLRGERQAALRVLRKAVASPSSRADDRVILCHVLGKLGRHQEARKWFDLAAAALATSAADDSLLELAVQLASEHIAREPRDARLYQQRARWNARLKRRSAALADFTRALEIDPGLALKQQDAPLLFLRAAAAVRRENWQQASADLTRVVGFPHVDARDWFAHALVLLYLGDSDGYRKSCAAMCKQFAETENRDTLLWLARSCALAPQAVTRCDSIIRRLEKGVADTPGSCVYRHTLGALLYRAGKPQEAMRVLNEAVELHHKTGAVSDWLFLAMAHHRQGQADQARQWLAKAVGVIDRVAKQKTIFSAAVETDKWIFLLEAQILRREAEALVQGPVRKGEK